MTRRGPAALAVAAGALATIRPTAAVAAAADEASKPLVPFRT
jgi:hypothetical protein